MVLTTQLLYALPFVALAATALVRLARPLPAAVWMNGAVLLRDRRATCSRARIGAIVVFALPPAAIQLCLLAGRIGATRAKRPRGVMLTAAVCVAALLASCVRFAVWMNQAAGNPSYGPRVPLATAEPGLSIAFAAERDPIPAPAREAGRADLRRARRAADLLRHRDDESDALPGDPHGLQRGAGGRHPGRAAAHALRGDERSGSAALDVLLRRAAARAGGARALLSVAPYFPVELDTWILVLERAGDRGATAIDLIARPAHAWVRDEPGQERDEPEPAPRLPARHNRRSLGMRLGQWGGGLDWQIDVPKGARLQLDTGFLGMASTDDIHEHPLMSQHRGLRCGGTARSRSSTDTCST